MGAWAPSLLVRELNLSSSMASVYPLDHIGGKFALITKIWALQAFEHEIHEDRKNYSAGQR